MHRPLLQSSVHRDLLAAQPIADYAPGEGWLARFRVTVDADEPLR